MTTSEQESHAAAVTGAATALTFEEVTVSFRRPGKDGGVVTALDRVSFEMRQGELLVLVGLSGSGKTTALNVVAGLIEPTSGTATVLGSSPIAARDRLSYMLSRDALLPWRTAIRNVELPLEVRGMPRAKRRKAAAEFLDMMHLSDRVDNYPGQLSQGQRQRVALARTWISAPEILLMDEPFAALDAETRAKLQLEFVRLWQRDRRSIVFVTHDINEAITLADRILVFADARIVGEFTIPIDRPRDIVEISALPLARDIYHEIRACFTNTDRETT